MRARLIALAVANIFPPMRYEHAALHGMTTWPHGYQSRPFLARAPLRIPKGA